MANTVVEILGLPSGLSGPLVKLFTRNSDTLLNTGGDTLTERTNKKGAYTGTVTENITGYVDAIVTLSDGTTPIFAGVIPNIVDDTGTYRVVDDGMPTTNSTGAVSRVTLVDTVTDVTENPGLDAAAVRAAVGLASANLDTQLSTIDDFLDTEVAAIKTKTDFLPSATAGASGGLLIAGSNAATTFATLTSTGAFTINGVSDVAQTGDSFARIGSTGSGLTSLAPSSTALSTATWTGTLATNLATTNTKVAFLPSATAGAAGGLFIAGTNAATVITGSLTTTFTGNLTGNVGGNVTGSVGSISGITFPTNFGTLGINVSGHVLRVVLTDTVTNVTEDIAGDVDEAAIATAVRNELATELARIDVATSTRMATFSLPTNFSTMSINASGHVVLADSSLVTAKLGTFVLAKTTNITGFTDISAAQVNAEVDTAILEFRLDELVAADSDIDGAAPPVVGSVFFELMSKTAGSFTFDQTTDSNEAIRDNQAGGVGGGDKTILQRGRTVVQR